MRAALRLVAASFLAAHAAASYARSYAQPGLVRAIERVRMRDCGARSAGLREDPRLGAVAARVAGGETLRAAMRDAGFVAARSTLLRVTGGGGDRETAQDLAHLACRTLSDPSYRLIGVARRADESWIVLASADSLPSADEERRFASDALRLVNRARATGARCGRRRFGPAPPLRADPRLSRAARAYAAAMARSRVFSHRGTDGSTPAVRVRRAGYGAYAAIGENIAAGAMTPGEAVRGWLASAGHCENIMDPRFRDTGIAFALDPSGPYGIYWAEDFGAPSGR